METQNLRSVHTLRRAGRLAEAERVCRELVAREGGDAEAVAVLGLLVAERREVAEAIELLRRAVEMEPGSARHRGNLGAMLARMGQNRQAEEELAEAVRLEPAYVPALLNLGALRMGDGRVREAADTFAVAVEAAPANSAACRGLAASLLELGDVEGAMTALRRFLARAPDSPAVHSDLLFAMLHEEAATPRSLLEEAREWGRRFGKRRSQEPEAGSQKKGEGGGLRVEGGELKLNAEPCTGTPADLDAERRVETRPTGRRLRVGYLSPDFRRHTIARLIEPILRRHDRSRFEVFCYSAVTRPDDKTDHLRKLADVWREIAALDDAHAEQIIRADRIDILVDLAGHMNGNRLPLLARRPAPIQVQLGYAGTTGVEEIDYRITDVYCDPPALSKVDAFHEAEARAGVPAHATQNDAFAEGSAYYTERLVRLPRCAWCYEPEADAPEVGPLPAIGNGIVTFGCLNRAAKLSDGAIALWAQILRQVPHSRLILLGAQRDGDNAYLREKLRRAGSDLSAVKMLERLPQRQYLAALAACDIALDPFPYNGDTTSCDALWMGVPVITLTGDRFASRRGVGLLKAVGMDELVASSPEQYVQIAMEMSKDLPRLAKLRADLRQRMSNSALADGARYTQELEMAYLKM